VSRPPFHRLAWLFAVVAAAGLEPGWASAQQSSSPPIQALNQQNEDRPIGRTSAAEVRVSGAVELHQGEMLLGNGSTVTAANQTVKIALARGGQLRLCSTTSLHLSRDRSIDDPENTSLMMALDRGALEADYTAGKYSDVLLTPDLRILVSGPGETALSVRVNKQGDTCVDNHGANAPYVTVSSQLEGGVYRVMPNQRVTFEHGSLRDVVDHETESCGCPVAPAISVASAGVPSQNAAKPGQPVGGPSSTPADTAFPLAESEGLAAPPPPLAKPVVPAGQAHAEVTVPLTYNGEHPAAAPTATLDQAAVTSGATSPVGSNGTDPGPAPHATNNALENTSVKDPGLQNVSAPATSASAPAAIAAPAPEKHSSGNVFRRIGHFFSRIFGG
jgi:hypothetical protein